MIATTGMGFKIHANTPKELKAKQFVLIKEKDFNRKPIKCMIQNVNNIQA